MASDLGSAVSRLEAVATRLEALAVNGGQSSSASSGGDQVALFVTEFDAIVNGPLAKFLSVANTIGGDIKAMCEMVRAGFQMERDFLVMASKHNAPSPKDLPVLLAPLSKKIADIQDFREKNRRSDFFNHLSTISESVPALGWVAVTPKPGPFIKDMQETGTFYSNRVLKDYKDKDAKHVDWVKSWTAVLVEMQAYVKQHHTTGVSWNKQGPPATANAISSSSSSGSSSAGPPPPPPPPGPPPPPEVLMASSGAGNQSGGDDTKNALFASINKGADITTGLKKVTDDMKTHKNPALRQGPAPFKVSTVAPPATKPKPGTPFKPVAQVKPPVFELQGKKWIIENQKDNKSIVVEGDMRQTVYVFKCEGTVVHVKGKINSVVLDTCKKTAVVFDDVLSSVEFVNCQSVQGQVNGKLNTVSIDKTDGCQFYLSKASLGIEIVTAKSSEMNILVPTDDGDFKEFALPEQYKTMFNGKTMVTTATDSI